MTRAILWRVVPEKLQEQLVLEISGQFCHVVLTPGKKHQKMGICWQKDIVSNDSSRDAFRSVPNAWELKLWHTTRLTASLEVVRCVNLQPRKKIGQFQKIDHSSISGRFFFGWLQLNWAKTGQKLRVSRSFKGPKAKAMSSAQFFA